MSTNKTLKRIALVAVASLGFSLVSVAPSKAAQVFTTSTITLTAAAAEVTAGGTASIAAVASTPALSANNDVATLKAVLTSKPAGAFGGIYTDQTADTATCDFGADVAAANAAGVISMTLTYVAGETCAAASQTFGSFKYNVSVAGAYTMRVWNDQDANGAVSLGEEFADISFTGVASNSTPSATYSSISAWDATAYSKAAGTDAGTAETVTIKNTADAALNGQTVRAVVNGPGTVKLTNAAAATVLGRDVSLALAANENTVALLLEADGNAGSTTVDVYAGTTKILTTAAVAWYGTLATLKVVQNKSIVTKNTALTGALTISGLDADGNAVPLADNTIVGTSSDATVLVTKDNDDDAVTAGVLTLQITGANDITTTSGRTATMTWKYLISGTTYTPEVVTTFSIGGALNALTISLDKSTYAPGEKVTATITAKDASGNPSGDATVIAANGLTSSIALQGLPNAAVVATVGGTATATFFAPASSGTFTISGAYSDALAAAQVATATATVVSAAEETAAAAADAAAEAIDAANAATDAANLAAEAADAATVAAEEARDAADAATAAVEELATQVATLMAALKAQITTLANTVAKIAKKVKA